MNVEKHVLAPGEGTPNSALPMIIYRGAIPPTADLDKDIASTRDFLAKNGWNVVWYTDKGLHPFHHFHSNAHEIVWVARGHQRGVFGGPNGLSAKVYAGDLIVLPAGTGHHGFERTDDLYMIGGYPMGVARGNLMKSEECRAETFVDEIAAVPLPVDPLTGRDGALTDAWRQST